ncbi:MAG: hypothetical protein V2I82_11395 [Halieaceae bacterium]|jgi:hypothetical protein|nr:hypothetical protein [Halieaceae bacterium]
MKTSLSSATTSFATQLSRASRSRQHLCAGLSDRAALPAPLRAVALVALVALGGHAQAQIPAIPEVPQIPAFLPMMSDVPTTQPLSIDGEWMISSIKKRIRIDSGRAYAVDPWTHLFVLKIEPMMVVIKDVQRTGPRQFSGSDLPLMGGWSATLTDQGYLDVSVAGALGPVKYKLMPVRLDDRQAFEWEKSGQSQVGVYPPPQGNPYQDFRQPNPYQQQPNPYQGGGYQQPDPYQQPNPYQGGGYQQQPNPYQGGGYQQQPNPYQGGGYQQQPNPYQGGGYQQPPNQYPQQGQYQPQPNPYQGGGYQQPNPYPPADPSMTQPPQGIPGEPTVDPDAGQPPVDPW